MQKQDGEDFIPLWLWGIVAIEIAIPTFFGFATIANPSIWGIEALDAVGQLYVTRNFTMALAVLIAALLRNRTALLVTIAARFMTDVIDIGAGLIRDGAEGAPMLLTFAVILVVIPFFGLRWLYNNRQG